MRSVLQKNWWSVSVRGLLLVAFGLFMLLAGEQQQEERMIYLGVTELLLGLIYCISAITTRKNYSNWTVLLVIGIIDLLLGIFALVKSQEAALYLGTIVGIFGMVLGGILIFMAIPAKTFRVYLIINGAISIAFGLLIFFNPLENRPELFNFIVGFYTIVLGIYIIYFGFRLRTIGGKRWSKLITDHDDKDIPPPPVTDGRTPESML